MSAFDLRPGEADGRIRELMRLPETASSNDSAWSAIPLGVAAAAVEVGGNVIDVGTMIGQAAAAAVNENAAKMRREEGYDLQTEASRVQYDYARSLRPDPMTAGLAENIVFGVTRSVTKAGTAVLLGPVTGAAAFGVSEGLTDADNLAAKGVDRETRTKAGMVSAAVNAAGVALPVAGSTAGRTAALVAAGGPASYIAHQSATREILRSANYDHLAEEYKPFDPVGLAVSTAAPAVFGAGAHALRNLKGEPRGIRNNNPGNLVKSDIPWDGKVAGTDSRFESFATPEQGIAALARNLITYSNRHGLRTVESIINRWAPPKENQTGAYAAAVAKDLGVKPGDEIDLGNETTLLRLTQAIIRHENGKQPYAETEIAAGVKAAMTGRSLRATPEQLDAARIMNLADHADGTSLARADDFEGAALHLQALEQASRMIDEGLPVRVADGVRVDPERFNAEALRFADINLPQRESSPRVDPSPVPLMTLGDAVQQEHFRASSDAARTPEQRAAYQALADDPTKLIPSGELDPEGRPIVRAASEILAEAEAGRLSADEEVRAVSAAITCFLRG